MTQDMTTTWGMGCQAVCKGDRKHWLGNRMGYLIYTLVTSVYFVVFFPGDVSNASGGLGKERGSRRLCKFPINSTLVMWSLDFWSLLPASRPPLCHVTGKASADLAKASTNNLIVMCCCISGFRSGEEAWFRSPPTRDVSRISRFLTWTLCNGWPLLATTSSNWNYEEPQPGFARSKTFWSLCIQTLH